MGVESCPTGGSRRCNQAGPTKRGLGLFLSGSSPRTMQDLEQLGSTGDGG